MTIIIDINKEVRSQPAMPSACQSGGCGCAPASPKPQLKTSPVRVNGVEIDAESIAREMQHHAAPDPETAWSSAARALAIRELLAQEARRQGIEATPETDEAGRVECEDDAAIRELLDISVSPEEPSDEECRRFYQARRERFRTPDLFEAAHILFEPGDGGEAGWAAAKSEAKKIIAIVGDNADDFAAAAQKLSGCPSAQQGGSLGQISKGQLVPAIQDVLESLRNGSLHPEPVRTSFGWHVVRLHRRIPGRELPYEAVAPKIADALAARGWSRASTRYVTELAAAATVEGISIDAETQ